MQLAGAAAAGDGPTRDGLPQPAGVHRANSYADDTPLFFRFPRFWTPFTLYPALEPFSWIREHVCTMLLDVEL